ncbi:hypothetical protein IGI53_002772 [Enterococcus sp. DIV0788_1]
MIVVTKLDRFVRNTPEALEIIEPLLDDDITSELLTTLLNLTVLNV